MTKPRDTFIVSFGDWHSGGLTALFPNYPMTFEYDKNNKLPYRPSLEQSSMYKHFLGDAKKTKELSKGMKKVIVLNGDAIEGNHHNTIQIISPNPKHHVQIHIELMETFIKESGFSVKNGDELHYVTGTESHTGWEEYGIQQHFEPIGAQYHDELYLTVNGKRLWWVHQGAKPGKGVNEGNPLRNYARDAYWDCVKEKREAPHMITSSHFHKNTYDSFSDSYRHTIHYQTLPSWQMKTKFAKKVSAFQRNDIGTVFNIVTESGDVRFFEPVLWGWKQ